MEFRGKTAVVTGSGQGIGLAIAKELVDRGTKVTLVDRNRTTVEAASAMLQSRGGDAKAYVCDLSDDEQVEAFGRNVVVERGLPDLVVNNAYAPILGGIDEIVLDDWRRAFDVNVLGYVRIIKAFAPAMQARGSGHFVNVASPMGIMPDPFGAASMMPYCSTKGACIALTGALATALVPHGVGVSIFYPDVTNTWSGRPPGAVSSGFIDVLAKLITGGATPESSARALLDGLKEDRYLISAEPGFEARLVDGAKAGFDPMRRAGVAAKSIVENIHLT